MSLTATSTSTGVAPAWRTAAAVAASAGERLVLVGAPLANRVRLYFGRTLEEDTRIRHVLTPLDQVWPERKPLPSRWWMDWLPPQVNGRPE